MRRSFIVVAAGAIFCGLTQTASAQTFVPQTGPGWYGSLGTIALNRENPEYDIIARNAAGAPAYTTSGADFDGDFGYDLKFGRRFAGDWAVESRYFNVKMDTTLPTVFSPNGAVTPYNNFNVPSGLGLANPLFASGTYASRLQSVEFNARRQAGPNVGLLYGFRYLELAEELAIQYDPVGVPTLRDRQWIGGRNEMFGGQFGMDALLWRRSWLSVSGFSKSGVYYNSANSRAGDLLGNPLILTRQAAGRDSEMAYVSEMGLNLNLQLTRRLSLYSGYNIMYLGGVALASDQILGTDPNGSGTIFAQQGPVVNSAVDTSHLWLHGITMGLSWIW